VSIRRALSDAWRKNAPEVIAWWNGSLPSFVAARRPAELSPGVPVFSYHLVERETFESDLAFLQRNGYGTLGSADLLEHLIGARNAPARSVVLTFDDGPRNFFDVALPLLQKYRARAVAFIAPGLHVDDEPNDATDRPMTWTEIATAASSGCVEFQSHTFESRFVPRWPMPVPLAGCSPTIENPRRRPPVPLEQDLRDSRAAIAARLPRAVVEHLAFPMYEGSDAGIRAAAAVGFKACYWGLVDARPLNRPGDTPFRISRVSDEFVRRLPGEGRSSLAGLVRERARRVRAGRAWRRRFA
jgi:peptidoglycan/xylan/chitin deacetylase (PgdA/CDA1 family)